MGQSKRNLRASYFYDPLDITGQRARADEKKHRDQAAEEREEGKRKAEELGRSIPGGSEEEYEARADEAADSAWEQRKRELVEQKDGVDSWSDFPPRFRDGAEESFKRQYKEEWKRRNPHESFRSEEEAVRESPDDYFIDPEESELAKARASERSIEGQRSALEGLEGTADEFRNIYEQGGLDEITRAENERARRQAFGDARAQRQAAMQNLAARGMAGSGAQMQSALQSGQSAAGRAYMGRLQNLAEGRQRALQSLGMAGQMHGQAGQLGSQMRGQSFNEAKTRGAAVDAFNQYNTDYRRGLNQRQTDRQNQNTQWRHGARERATGMGLGMNVFGSKQQQSYAQQAAERQTENRKSGLALLGTIL